MKKIVVALIASLVIASAIGFAATQISDTSTITITSGGTAIATYTASNFTMTKKPTGDSRGTIEAGTLGTISPDDDFTGDLAVTVTLENAGELDFFDLSLRVAIYDKKSKLVESRLVSLALQHASLAIPFGTGWDGPYTVKIDSGSYQVMGGGTLSPKISVVIAQKDGG